MMIVKLLILTMALEKYCTGVSYPIKPQEINYNELDEHTLVTDSEVFPFVAAILKKSMYLSAGALISSDWVLTAGDSMFMVREAVRLLRIRLGSINYKKGGVLLPIKNIEIHPYFDDKSPVFDLALIKLSSTVRFTASLNPIRLQKSMREADATHFIVTSWQSPLLTSDESGLKSMELIKRRRLLTVTHLHPAENDECVEELMSIGINNSWNMMCLDTGAMLDPCVRDVGAPVVLNGVLWGIISSWIPKNCENGLAGSSFVSLVSSPNVSTWIHSNLNGHAWINDNLISEEAN